MPISFWWMLYEMTQCLVFALACNLRQILALFFTVLNLGPFGPLETLQDREG